MKNLLGRFIGIVPSPNGPIVQLRLGPNKTKEEIETWMGDAEALVGIMHAPAEIQLSNKKSEKKKGGNLAKRAGQWCKEDKFQAFLLEEGYLCDIGPNPTMNESNAVKAIYRECGIKSRTELDDPEHKPAADLFKSKFIRPYAEYLKG